MLTFSSTKRKYVPDLLANTQLFHRTPADFSMSKILHLSMKDDPKLPDLEIYRRIIGKLLCLNLTRQDISYVV